MYIRHSCGNIIMWYGCTAIRRFSSETNLGVLDRITSCSSIILYFDVHEQSSIIEYSKSIDVTLVMDIADCGCSSEYPNIDDRLVIYHTLDHYENKELLSSDSLPHIYDTMSSMSELTTKLIDLMTGGELLIQQFLSYTNTFVAQYKSSIRIFENYSVEYITCILDLLYDFTGSVVTYTNFIRLRMEQNYSCLSSITTNFGIERVVLQDTTIVETEVLPGSIEDCDAKIYHYIYFSPTGYFCNSHVANISFSNIRAIYNN